MSAPPARAKQSSRWGSLLSGAVAGLESRLDTFFEEEGRAPQTAGTTPKVTGLSTANASVQARSLSLTRTESIRKDGAVRLAAQDDAIARSASETRTAHTTVDPDTASRPSLDSTTTASDTTRPPKDTASPRLSQEIPPGEEEKTAVEGEIHTAATQVTEPDRSVASDTSARPSLEAEDVTSIVQPDTAEALSGVVVKDAAAEDASAAEYQSRISQLQTDLESAELQRQEEVHSYLERLDALQAKLQYLAKEAAETARKSASDATGDSLQRKLAAKDEQIALLMEEGQKLSKAEVNQAGIARKLRIKAAEDAKAITEMKRKQSASDKLAEELSGKIRRLEASQRDTLNRVNRIPQLEKEIKIIKASRDEHASTVQYLRSQAESESKKVQEAESKANTNALEQERKTNQSLQEDLANAKIEKRLSEDRLRAEIRSAKEDLEREQERNKGAEFQMRNEINVLETRMESMRARTEEASSASTGDSRAKLMRQIEIMQSQYSVASENWQGIESSLQTRLTAMEKERDDASRAEADSRKRARESANANRRLQEQLDDTVRKCSTFELELGEQQGQAEKLENRVRELEQSLKDAQRTLENERSSWNLNLASRIEDEKIKWRQENASLQVSDLPNTHAESPGLGIRRSYGQDVPSISTRLSMGGRQQSVVELGLPYAAERPYSRRSSYKHARGYDATSPTGLDSGRSTPGGLNGNIPETPSIHTADADDMFDNDSSPHRTVNDMLSVSTATAGPSVQLVERMSAAVRRLESEKAASKDELARLVSQRDEARKEVVGLMAEIEGKRDLDTKVKKLETDLASVEQRYQTTLEMLGEKSERVDELENDILDLKKIYRELVETMK